MINVNNERYDKRIDIPRLTRLFFMFFKNTLWKNLTRGVQRYAIIAPKKIGEKIESLSLSQFVNVVNFSKFIIIMARRRTTAYIKNDIVKILFFFSSKPNISSPKLQEQPLRRKYLSKNTYLCFA